MTNPIQAIKNLYGETITALKKCNWPDRHELKGETIAVISFLILTTVFLFVADHLFLLAIRYICM